MTSVDEGEIKELSHSGIQFIAHYIGSVPVKASLRDMRSSDLRVRVVKYAIFRVALDAGLVTEADRLEDSVASLLIGDEPMKLSNVQVALNVSSKALSMSHADPTDPNKNGGLVARHALQFISFAGHGEESMESFFGYIAKVRGDRRCHVVRLRDVRVSRVMACVEKAMELNTASSTSNSSPLKIENLTVTAPRNSSEENAALGLLWKQYWYHGLLSREDTEKKLANVGDFLVRQSGHQPGQVILSGRDSNRVHHILLMDEQLGKVVMHDHQFNSVVDLINHHYSQRVPIYSEDISLTLSRPVHRQLD